MAESGSRCLSCRDCTPAGLVDVGEHDAMTGGTGSRDYNAGREAVELRREGHVVRVDTAAALAPGCVRVVTLRKRPALFRLCQNRAIGRMPIVLALEDISRWGLLRCDPVTGVNVARSIFMEAS